MTHRSLEGCEKGEDSGPHLQATGKTQRLSNLPFAVPDEILS